MPFPANIKEYRIWSVANQKCLVLEKDKVTKSQPKVTCAGEGDEDGTIEKGLSKSQLFIFIAFTCTQLVTYLTINFDSQ